MRALYLTAASVTTLNILFVLRAFLLAEDVAILVAVVCLGAYVAVAAALIDGWRARRAIAGAQEVAATYQLRDHNRPQD